MCKNCSTYIEFNYVISLLIDVYIIHYLFLMAVDI